MVRNDQIMILHQWKFIRNDSASFCLFDRRNNITVIFSIDNQPMMNVNHINPFSHFIRKCFLRVCVCVHHHTIYKVKEKIMFQTWKKTLNWPIDLQPTIVLLPLLSLLPLPQRWRSHSHFEWEGEEGLKKKSNRAIFSFFCWLTIFCDDILIREILCVCVWVFDSKFDSIQSEDHTHTHTHTRYKHSTSSKKIGWRLFVVCNNFFLFLCKYNTTTTR